MQLRFLCLTIAVLGTFSIGNAITNEALIECFVELSAYLGLSVPRMTLEEANTLNGYSTPGLFDAYCGQMKQEIQIMMDKMPSPNTGQPTTFAPSGQPTTSSPSGQPTTYAPSIQPTTSSPTSQPSTFTPSIQPTTSSPTSQPSTFTSTDTPTTSAPIDPPSNKPVSSFFFSAATTDEPLPPSSTAPLGTNVPTGTPSSIQYESFSAGSAMDASPSPIVSSAAATSEFLMSYTLNSESESALKNVDSLAAHARPLRGNIHKKKKVDLMEPPDEENAATKDISNKGKNKGNNKRRRLQEGIVQPNYPQREQIDLLYSQLGFTGSTFDRLNDEDLTNRCDTAQAANDQLNLLIAEIADEAATGACSVADAGCGADLTGASCIGAAAVCGVATTSGATLALWKVLVLGCQTHDGLVDGAEIEATFENVNGLHTKADKLQGDVDNLHDKVDILNEKIDKINKKVDALIGLVTSLGTVNAGIGAADLVKNILDP